MANVGPAKRMLLAGVAFPLLTLIIIMFFSAQLDRHQIAFGTKVPKDYEFYGIDVSHHQGMIRWEELANYEESDKKVGFVFMKATEGTQIIDAMFEKNWTSAKRMGIFRGAYHFYRPEEPADKQAMFFLKNVRLEKGDLPAVVDVEI
ncbi:MAG: glycoside hydrolase, partial [Flammeovirgaceae bacterium]|nr:glycoside hydrolase [Flammeovirgaceae bacterium]MDW8288736.1 GH25 family lysozyme [Flammeovirgaceae bacterium]